MARPYLNNIDFETQWMSKAKKIINSIPTNISRNAAALRDKTLPLNIRKEKNVDGKSSKTNRMPA